MFACSMPKATPQNGTSVSETTGASGIGRTARKSHPTNASREPSWPVWGKIGDSSVRPADIALSIRGQIRRLRNRCSGTWHSSRSGFQDSRSKRKPAADLLREANEAYRSMHSDEAVRLYTEYLKQDPSNASVRIFLGAALLNLNRLDEARREANQALAADAKSPKAYVLLGRIDSAGGAWDVAQQSFARAISLDPSDRDALYFSGRAFYDANRFEPAIERFESALALGATQSRTYENLALCYEALHQPEKAESIIPFGGSDGWRSISSVFLLRSFSV